MTLETACFDARGAQAPLCDRWRALAGASPRRDLATSADWFWNNLDWISPPENGLSFVTVKDGERVVGMIPIEMRSISLSGIGVRCAGFIDGPYAMLDTAILAGNDPERTAGAFASHLFGVMRGWSCFSTAGIDSDSPSGRALLNQLSARGRVLDRGSEARPYVSLDGGWPGYLASRSTNFRRNLRRAERQLSRTGRLDYRSESPRKGLELVESLDQRSWRMAKERDVAVNARLVAYCRNLCTTFPEPAAHVVRCLTLDDIPVASFYGLIHGNVFYAIKVNYDISHSDASPGFVLLIRVFEEMASRGIERIELLGRNEYLHRLGNASHHTARMLVFNRSVRGRALGLAGMAARRMRGFRFHAGAQA